MYKTQAYKTEWTPLDRTQIKQFVSQIADKNLPYIFEPDFCETAHLPLSFYPGYHIVRLINKTMVPYLLMDFISDGTNYHYMDGSDAVFTILNKKNILDLSIENVFQYVDLFLSYVYERGNSLELATTKQADATTVNFDETTQTYIIETNLKFQDRITRGKIHVHANGCIDIVEPINTRLLSNNAEDKTPQFIHPQSSQIIEQIEGLMSISETGMLALKTKQELGADIRILPSPDYQLFCTDTKTAYITMPAAEQNAKYTQAIQYIGAIKDIDLKINEKRGRPAPYQANKDLEADAFMLHISKNLDIAIETCKMISELEEQNIDEAVHALQKLGLGELYKAYKVTEDKNTLLGVYLGSIKTYLESTEE